MITLIGLGYIGTHIAKKLRQFEWISHNETSSKNSKFIINATGYIGHPNVDACETNKELCLSANTLFPLALEKNSSVPILHISTGCIYDGYPKDGWKETDTPNLNLDTGSFYSGCKVLTEKFLSEYLKDRSYLFRIRMPFCDTFNKKNLLFKYNNYQKLVDTTNSITCVEDLVKCVLMFVEQRPDPGIYNVVNKNTTTTRNITDKMGLSDVKEWMSKEEFESSVKARRSNCSLNTYKIQSVYNMPDIDTALDKMIFNYKKFT